MDLSIGPPKINPSYSTDNSSHGLDQRSQTRSLQRATYNFYIHLAGRIILNNIYHYITYALLIIGVAPPYLNSLRIKNLNLNDNVM